MSRGGHPESERASRKKSGLRLDDDLTEKLKENRLDGVADLLRKSRVSSMAMLKEHSLAELEETLRRSGGTRFALTTVEKRLQDRARWNQVRGANYEGSQAQGRDEGDDRNLL